MSAPGAIEPVQASVAGHTVTLSWSPAAGATSYVITAGLAPGRHDFVIKTPDAVPSFTADAASGEYYVRVRALGDGGTGPASIERLIVVTPD